MEQGQAYPKLLAHLHDCRQQHRTHAHFVNTREGVFANFTLMGCTSNNTQVRRTFNTCKSR